MGGTPRPPARPARSQAPRDRSVRTGEVLQLRSYRRQSHELPLSNSGAARDSLHPRRTQNSNVFVSVQVCGVEMRTLATEPSGWVLTGMSSLPRPTFFTFNCTFQLILSLKTLRR